MKKAQKKSLARKMFKFNEERLCREQGYPLVAGVDEVGRGCLAGPVVAAAVIMPWEKVPPWYREVRDSKLLTPSQRERLSPLIHRAAISIGTGVVYPDIIDGFGMSVAVSLAMRRAVEKLSPLPGFVLIDHFTIPGCQLPQKGVRNGDSECFSIACASVVAKVFRDHLMAELDRRYPGYDLAGNKGYGTADHLHSLRRQGPSPLHRRSFGPVQHWAQLSMDDLLEMVRGLDNDGP